MANIATQFCLFLSISFKICKYIYKVNQKICKLNESVDFSSERRKKLTRVFIKTFNELCDFVSSISERKID